jgi:HAE1 family hydrophobic/amphiphilic exporter-1
MIRYFIDNRIAVFVLFATIILFGTLAILNLPIQLTPDVRKPAITVATFYPGATPEDVEQDIIVQQEEFLRGVPGVKKMTSTAQLGQAEIILEFSVGTDMSENLVRVNNALSQVPSYPENVDEPSLSTSSSSDQPVAWFSLRALPGMELKEDVRNDFDYAENLIKPQYERIPGVASLMGVFGSADKQMQVFIDPVKLADRGISIYAVREAIRRNNRDISGGDLNEGKRRYNVRTLGRATSPEDIENIIIDVRDGAAVHIRDVGYARIGIGEQRSTIRHNGRPALAFGVRHQPGTNLLIVMEQVKALTKKLNEGELKDRGLRLTQVTDDTEYISDSTIMVRNNLIIGATLTLITLLVFLRNIKTTLILGVSLPLCVMGALMLIRMFGLTINVITLAGLAFSIGSVIDNSIVVLENIYRHRMMGKGAKEAAVFGTNEVWSAVLSSTLTNVVVFVPIIMLQEEAGQLFRDLAIAITSTNIMSMIAALFVIPCLAAYVLKTLPDTTAGKGLVGRAHNLFGLMPLAVWAFELLEKFLRWLMSSVTRRIAVVGGLVFFAASLIVIFLPKTEYLPEGNQNSIFAMMIPPQGYNIDEMTAIGEGVEQKIRPYAEAAPGDFAKGKIDGPALQDFFFVGFGANMFMFTRAEVASEASKVPGLLVRYLSEVPGVIPIASQMSIFESDIRGSRGIEVDIVGDDVSTTTYIALQAFLKVFSELPGAQPRPIPGIEIGQPQLTIRPNWARAAELGIGAEAIGYGAWVLGDGAYADSFYENGKKLDLYMYSTLGAFDTLSSFDSIRIATDEGNSVPISSVANVEFSFVPEQIRRVDQRRAVTLQIVPPANLSLEEAIAIVDTKIIGALKEEGKVPPGYELRIGGSSDKLAAVRESLSGDFFLALLLVYLTLALVFKHLGHPLTIMCAVPIGLTGGVIGLKVLNVWLGIVSPGTIQSLDILTMLGFVILLGSIVNNPILIVEQSLNFIREGMEQNEAIIQATLSRIRPIMMTTGTTTLGLLPLVVLPGAGSELYRGIGVVTFGGLFLGTITTVFFVPALLSLIMGARGSSKNET